MNGTRPYDIWARNQKPLKARAKSIHETMGFERRRRRDELTNALELHLNSFMKQEDDESFILSLWSHHFWDLRKYEENMREWEWMKSVRDFKKCKWAFGPVSQIFSKIHILNINPIRKHRSESDKNGPGPEYGDLRKTTKYRLLNMSRWWHEHS